MNPRASIELNNAEWEASPYDCKCRHRKRGPTVGAVSVEGAGGEYEASPSSSKAKGKAPGLTTVKSASKPQGIIKKALAQPRRKKMPPPLKLTEATLTPAQASEDAEGHGDRVQAYVSPPPERGQGVKRMLEECSGDEEDGPLAKKAKVGGAASVDGGRKKAPLKKSSKKKGPME